MRAIREARDMTVEQLADAIGVTAAHLSNVEHGKRGLSNEKLTRAAEVLCVTTLALRARPFNEPRLCAVCGAEVRAS